MSGQLGWHSYNGANDYNLQRKQSFDYDWQTSIHPSRPKSSVLMKEIDQIEEMSKHASDLQSSHQGGLEHRGGMRDNEEISLELPIGFRSPCGSRPGVISKAPPD